MLSLRSSALRLQVESALAHRVPGALTVHEKPAPEVFPTGITALDALMAMSTGLGGLPRSALTELCGPASSGRTSVLLSLLAQATARQEACALIDASDAFHPESAQAAGVDLTRLLWVRCGQSPSEVLPLRFVASSAEKVSPRLPKPRKKDFARLEQALKATDLLLQSGGFGLLVVDLSDIPPDVARRVPLTSWFRFRRAVEETSTALIVMEQEPFAKTCASLVLRFRHQQTKWSSLVAAKLLSADFYAPAAQNCAAVPTHARLLCGLELDVEIARARKGSQSSGAVVMTQTAWSA